MDDISEEVVAIETWDSHATYLPASDGIEFFCRSHHRRDGDEALSYTWFMLGATVFPAILLSSNAFSHALYYVAVLFGIPAFIVWRHSRPTVLTLYRNGSGHVVVPRLLKRPVARKFDNVKLLCVQVVFPFSSFSTSREIHTLALRDRGNFFFSLVCSRSAADIQRLLASLDPHRSIELQKVQCGGVRHRSKFAFVSRLVYGLQFPYDAITSNGTLRDDVLSLLHEVDALNRQAAQPR